MSPLFMFICWFLVGIINLVLGCTNRFSYATIWIMLMATLLKNLIN